MKLNKALSTALRIFIPLAFGILILWLLYRNMDFDELWKTLKSDANFGIIGLSLIFGFIANTVRGLRWDILIKATGEESRVINSVLATHGNYAVNMALPRMGEVWRCGVMSHYSGIGFPKLFGTLLIDRAFDFVIVGLLLAFAGIFNIGFFSTFFENNPTLFETVRQIFNSTILYVGLAIFLFAAYIVWRYFRHLTLVQKIIGAVKNVWQGLKSIATLKDKWLFIIYSILLWGGYFLFFYTTFFAFSFTADLGLRIGLIAFIMSSIAVAAPVQAGMGAWHFMVIYTLAAFGVSKSDAGSFALIVHTIQTLFTTLIGIIAMGLLPVVNKKVTLGQK
ncbi:lysylphosphatidylglycerol synthase transmembrane domain-containing protein [Porphyromonas sp.]|uniref:lysylphosphatidylglycerol synthase transmembrane domain-containing protein n=1 Tax=Porphyromonas sp. TaxID=1924944 RepID=UPI0026DBB8A7|nr:lysylphosphatidylglycerol synthase transmembrane domain-containing protein [Porphyromonas sp.]MDO4770729.1 lysylphosphatidylglycerol synthase transmembrane domain-containing protein [Porphyromonas sp.]